MAKLCLFVLGCVTYLRAALCLLSPSQGENVTSPTNVTFQMGFFAHILIWNHDKTSDDGVLYEIEYISYGSSWTSVPHCHYISQQSCDLTMETLPKSLGYFGRVRSVLGNQTSEWSRSTRYRFTEVNLPPPHVEVNVNGPSLHVELTLPKVTKGNITGDYKDIFPINRIYKVRIRRTKDNHMFQKVDNVESFSITGLVGSNEYCLSVQPSIASRNNIGEASAEICTYLPEQGENLTSPTNVTFQMGFFAHVLIWNHDKTSDDGVLYEIEYLSYGSSWTSVPHCHYISQQSCDLTVETLPKSLGYFGRVRSVLGNQTSEWSRSTRYIFTEVNLPPPHVEVNVNGPSLHVELTLPKVTKGNITGDYKDIFPFNRIYKVRIRRTKDNHMFQKVDNVESFNITGLVGSNEYCLSVQPSIASRNNIGEASAEICTYLPEQGLTSDTLLILAVCVLSFLVLLICVNFFICLYIREVMKTPKTLKSLIQRSWSWMDKPPSPVIETTLCWETGLKDHLMAEPRDSPMRSSADSGFGSQLFINNILKASPLTLEMKDERDVSEPRSNFDFKEFSMQEEDPDRSVQGEDSGISLSTGSPTLKHTSSHTDTPYRGNTQSCDDSREEIVLNVRLGYLKQLETEMKPNPFEDQELETSWQPQVKNYLSQRPKNLCKDQTDCDFFQEPWIQVPETFQTAIPLTVAFSPFSRVLWDLGPSAPSLGDVEFLDTIS